MTATAIHMWYILFTEEKLHKNRSGLIQAINLCIQHIKKLFDTFDDYLSVCDRYKQMLRCLYTDTTISWNKIEMMKNDIDDEGIKVSSIVQRKTTKQELVKLYNLKLLLEEQIHKNKNEEISLNTTLENLYHMKRCNQEYLHKINTLLTEVLIKSNDVCNKVEDIEDFYIEEIYVKMSKLRNVYNMVEDNKGKFFIQKSDKNAINIYNDIVLIF